MPSGLYNRFKANLFNGLIKLAGAGSDTIKCMLLTGSHSFDADHDTKSQIVDNEVSGTGYTAGGATLANKSVTESDANDKAVFDADDVTWVSSTITARYAVLYDDTLTNDDLICCFDFGANKSSSAGNFTISWQESGVIDLS